MPTAITPEFFAQSYVKGFRQTVRFLLTKGAGPDLAEDVAQTAWARGWEARGQLQREDRIQPWVNTIAYHRLCRDQRRSVRHCELTEYPDSHAVEPAWALDAAAMLARCSPIERVLLKQRYTDGMEMKEIAARQGLSEIAVRLRIHRCQGSLRRAAGSPVKKSQ